MGLLNFFTGFFTNRTIPTVGGMRSVVRYRDGTEQNRVSAATALLDMYYGFGLPYIKSALVKNVTNTEIQKNMVKLAVCLPLLEHFVQAISKVYDVQPDRRFFLDGKEIVPKIKEGVSDDSRYYVNEELYGVLNGFYSSEVCSKIQESEKLVNLLSTAIFKVTTNEEGKINLGFVPNDTAVVIPKTDDLTKAEEILYCVGGEGYFGEVLNGAKPFVEAWTDKFKYVRSSTGEDGVKSSNNAASETELLFGSRMIGDAFAPFAVLRSCPMPYSFWDVRNEDVYQYILSINVSLTHLRYMVQFSSFGLKYAVNIKAPEKGVLDPVGLWLLAVEDKPSSHITNNNNNNFEVGEFKNEGRMKEVVETIIFQLKMLYDIFNIPLDSLISSSSLRSAENRTKDFEQLNSRINAQREVWYLNERNLFRNFCSVHNRDNLYKIPPQVDIKVNFTDKTEDTRTIEDWLVLMQNDVVSILDWLSELNPDLNRVELERLIKSNQADNSIISKIKSNVNRFGKEEEADDGDDGDDEEEEADDGDDEEEVEDDGDDEEQVEDDKVGEK